MYSTTELTSDAIASDNPIHQRLFAAYIQAAPLIEGNLLEIGCGLGRGIDVLIEKAKQYTGIDKNAQLIEMLQAKYPTLQFVEQNIPPMSSLPDDTFDTIVSFQVIEHIAKDELFISEIKRVLKKGGKAIITTPNRKFSLTRNPWHIREYLPKELLQLCQKHFAQVEAKGIAGNELVMQYYAQNKKAVQKITRWDVLKMQYWLPRPLLQIPYEILNRMNRKKLHQQDNSLVTQIHYEDYFLSQDAENSLDLFYILHK
ncbi:MAG: class I SAM-dependent methyltransferase [Cytophagales bacterium]|nr:MAG: class I SAM-dependent methyltransferase [Cytophagales bacterium]